MVHDRQPVFAGQLNACAGEPRVRGQARVMEWFGRWRKPIRGWIAAKRSVPASESEDLTQEVFIRLLRYSDDVLVENPQAYLHRVATNVVNEWRVRCRVRLPHDESWLDELQLDADEEPQNVFARSEASQYLRDLVAKLPRRQREILLLHVEEGLTYKQIAHERGLTYRIVLRDLTRAYTKLRMSCLSEDL
jgi:RNA polymerase sigma-70 factor (ECF subfamily)